MSFGGFMEFIDDSKPESTSKNQKKRETDYSKMTDEQINEAIFSLQIGNYPVGYRALLIGKYDYTHDWRLCGELLEEMKDIGGALIYLDNVPKWECLSKVTWFAADTPQRAICEAWLAWKEQG